MKSFLFSNALAHRLMLASAGLLIGANGALPAEVVGDAQMQARDLLSGTVGGQPRSFLNCRGGDFPEFAAVAFRPSAHPVGEPYPSRGRRSGVLEFLS
jgi:hypothetical protein